MADVQTGGDSGGGRHQKKRAKKGSTHIDMTPMVDLAFLLLTFFILTTTMYKPSTLQLTFPVPNPDKEKPPRVANAITLLLTKNDAIFYYRGGLEPTTQLERTDFKQLTTVLTVNNKTAIERIQGFQKDLIAKKITEAAFDSLKNVVQREETSHFAIIKPDKDAKFRNMIDMVDEMDIHGIGKYAVQDSLKPEEQVLLDIAKQTL